MRAWRTTPSFVGAYCFGDAASCPCGNGGGASSYPASGDLPVSVRGGITQAGQQRHYQAWYRNAAAYCTPSTFNLTNGFSATWQP